MPQDVTVNVEKQMEKAKQAQKSTGLHLDISKMPPNYHLNGPQTSSDSRSPHFAKSCLLTIYFRPQTGDADIIKGSGTILIFVLKLLTQKKLLELVQPKVPSSRLIQFSTLRAGHTISCWSRQRLDSGRTGRLARDVSSRAGGRLHGSFLHHAHVEASLIPAGKESNLDNEVQSQLSPIPKGAI